MRAENFFSLASVQGVLSIDRITLLLFSPKLSLWGGDEKERRANEVNIMRFSKMFENDYSGFLDPEFPQGSPTELFRRHYRTNRGVDIQFGASLPVRHKIKDEVLLQAYGTLEEREQGFKWQYTPSYYCFRIEYNPNKTDLKELEPMFSKWVNFDPSYSVRVSRLDIAIDYACSIRPELILCHGVRKNAVFGGTHGAETVYFGRRGSKNMFRIYNKRQEIIDSGEEDIGHDLWRVELESSDSFFLSESKDHGKVFDQLVFVDGAKNCNDWVVNMLRENAVYSGSLLNTLKTIPSHDTRRRYKKMLEAMPVELIESPSTVYYREFGRVFNALRADIIRSCGQKIL